MREAKHRLDWEKLSAEARADRRRDRRFQLAFQIEVSGISPSGRVFAERTTTRDVSESGCCFSLKTGLARGDVVSIRLLGGDDSGETERVSPQLFRIAWVTREKSGWTAGAQMVEQQKIWPLDFPSRNRPNLASA